MEETAKRDDGSSSKSDRVALKKEIGLLTACAIIIGEWGGALIVGAVTLISQNRLFKLGKAAQTQLKN